MSPPGTLDELVGQLRRAGAADELAIERFTAGRPPGDPGSAEAASTAMVRDGLITPYQARRLLRGESRGLRIAGKYRVLDRLGGGGMGQVYLCEDARLGRAVAVKVLPAAHSRDPEAVARFEREARATALLDHPAIVRALDVGQDGGHPFLVLEFVDGADLYCYVAARGPLDPRTAAHYVAEAADALQRAADLGWVHRDVKPHNLMVDRAGRLRLLDLGLARPFTPDSINVPVTEQGGFALLGTADFIAPEQVVDSTQVDGRADVYSLGATFYFLLTGRPPFPEGTVAEKLTWHRTREPKPVRQVRPEVPEEMARILAKMMAKDPAARYQAPADVVDALAEWANPAPLPPAAEGLPNWPPAVRRLLRLPLSEPPVPAPPVVPALASSFPSRAAAADRAKRRTSRWIALLSVAAGLATAAVVALRTLPSHFEVFAAPSAGGTPSVQPTSPDPPVTNQAPDSARTTR